MIDGQKFHPVPGKRYRVVNTKFRNGKGMISHSSVHTFHSVHNTFDARVHGAGNPADYITYLFTLPEKLGQVSFYQFQITDMKEVKK